MGRFSYFSSNCVPPSLRLTQFPINLTGHLFSDNSLISPPQTGWPPYPSGREVTFSPLSSKDGLRSGYVNPFPPGPWSSLPLFLAAAAPLPLPTGATIVEVQGRLAIRQSFSSLPPFPLSLWPRSPQEPHPPHPPYGRMIYTFYVFTRTGNAMYFHDWNRKRRPAEGSKELEEVRQPPAPKPQLQFPKVVLASSPCAAPPPTVCVNLPPPPLKLAPWLPPFGPPFCSPPVAVLEGRNEELFDAKDATRRWDF